MKSLRRAALIALGLHLLAGIGMATVLRHGLETNPDFQDRLTFLVNHQALWCVAWLCWTAAALSILYFYTAFAKAHRPSPSGGTPLFRFAVSLTVAAVAADLSAQAMEIGVLPGIAKNVLATASGADLFLLLHRVTVMLSGYLANGLYSVTALILAWSARRTYPLWVSMAGMSTGLFGLLFSFAALADFVSGMFWSNVVLLPAILLWLAGVVRES